MIREKGATEGTIETGDEEISQKKGNTEKKKGDRTKEVGKRIMVDLNPIVSIVKVTLYNTQLITKNLKTREITDEQMPKTRDAPNRKKPEVVEGARVQDELTKFKETMTMTPII